MSYHIHILNWTRKLTSDMHAGKLSAMLFLFHWMYTCEHYWIAFVRKKRKKTFHLDSIFKEDESGEEKKKIGNVCLQKKSAGSWNQEEETFLVSVKLLLPFSPSSKLTTIFPMNVDLAFMLPLSKGWEKSKDSAVCVISAADATLVRSYKSVKERKWSLSFILIHLESE